MSYTNRVLGVPVYAWVIVLLLSASLTSAQNLPPGLISFTPVDGTATYLNITLDGIPAVTPPYDLSNTAYDGWCFDPWGTITASSGYAFKFAGPVPSPPYGNRTPQQFNQVNWILNNKAGYTVHQIQEAIWVIMEPLYRGMVVDPGSLPLADAALANGSSYVPGPGKIAAIGLAVDGINQNQSIDLIQDLFIEYRIPGGQVSANCSVINAVQGVKIPDTQLIATGGTGPYTFLGTGLPNGLSMSSSGLITGTPTVSGAYNYTVFIKDSLENTGSLSCALDVAPCVGPTCGPCIDPTGGALGGLNNLLFFFDNGSVDANWQSASKGFAGDVVVNGLIANERTSGSFAYAGTLTTNDTTLGPWQSIVNHNSSQATAVYSNTPLVSQLDSSLRNAMTYIDSLPASAGFASVSSTFLNGLDKRNGVAETFVINVTSGFQVSKKITICGDAGDTFILRWDSDLNTPGYQGQVKFQSGGAIVPCGGLNPGSFINVAGDISSSGGGSNPPAPYPQGPSLNGGTTLITGASKWNGGGFFTGYWLTTGDPVNGETHSLSNAIFVGGWYTLSTKFSLTSGTSGVQVCPPVPVGQTVPGPTVP